MKMSDPKLRPPDTWSKEEKEIILQNILEYDFIFSECRKKCGNCGYPLSDTQIHYEVFSIGEVCDLCHYLHSTVSRRTFFVDAHRKWEEENAKRKRERGD